MKTARVDVSSNLRSESEANIKMCHTFFKRCLEAKMYCDDGGGHDNTLECEEDFKKENCKSEYKQCIKKGF